VDRYEVNLSGCYEEDCDKTKAPLPGEEAMTCIAALLSKQLSGDKSALK